MIRELFDPSSYTFSFYALPVVVAGALNAAQGVATVRRERASIVSVTFCAMTLSTAVWLLSFGAIYSARDSSTALDWVRVEHIGLVCIPTTVLLFAAAVTGQLREKQAIVWIGAAVSVALYVIVVSTGWIVQDMHRFYWGYYPVSGKLAPALIAIHLLAGHGVRHHDLLLGKIGHARLHPPAPLPQIIIRRVGGQAIKPGLKNLRRAELIEREIQPEKNFLADVLHILRMPDQPRDGS